MVLLPLRASSMEIAVRLSGDMLALVLAASTLRPGVLPSLLWLVGALGSFAATGLYIHRLEFPAPLEELPEALIGSAVGVAAMSLVGPGGVWDAAAPALPGGFVVVFTPIRAHPPLGGGGFPRPPPSPPPRGPRGMVSGRAAAG